MLALFILVPLAALVLLNLPWGEVRKRLAFGLVLLLSLVQVGLVVLAGPALRTAEALPMGLPFTLNLSATGLSLVLLLCIGIVLFVTLLVSRDTVADARRFRFVNLLLVALTGMNGTVLATDLFSLYVFLEIVSVSSFILIAFDRDLKGLEGAFKYLLLSAVATVLMISSIAVLLAVAGDVSFVTVAEALRGATLEGAASRTVARLAVGAFLCGLFIKGGLVPFHGWLLGAYSAAPASVSVLLAGVATKVSGIYALLRLSGLVFTPSQTAPVFSPSGPVGQVLLLVGAASIIVGALAAIGQTDMKRMLAYSSISQVGYIILGLGCAVAAWGQYEATQSELAKHAAELAFAGAVFHLFNHAIFKSLLFVNSAALEQRLGTTDMTRMGGLSPRMPSTGVTCLLASLSTAGIPPLAGFWSKLLIIIALWQSGHTTYAGVAVLFSVVTLAYLLVIQRRVFFGKTPEELASVREASLGLVLPAIVLAAVTVGVGLCFPFLYDTFLVPVGGFLK